MGFCSKIIGYSFPYCFLEIFVGVQSLDGGDQSLRADGADPPVPSHQGKP